MTIIVDTDEVSPNLIEHRCEEIREGDALHQRYNYIVYHFERDGRYFWARTYLDDVGTISIFGPFERRDAVARIRGPLDDAILSYFKRRFKKIQAFGDKGYVPVWSRSA